MYSCYILLLLLSHVLVLSQFKDIKYHCSLKWVGKGVIIAFTTLPNFCYFGKFFAKYYSVCLLVKFVSLQHNSEITARIIVIFSGSTRSVTREN